MTPKGFPFLKYPQRYPEKGSPNGNISGDISKKGTPKRISTWMEVQTKQNAVIHGDIGKKESLLAISLEISEKNFLKWKYLGIFPKNFPFWRLSTWVSSKEEAKFRNLWSYCHLTKQNDAIHVDIGKNGSKKRPVFGMGHLFPTTYVKTGEKGSQTWQSMCQSVSSFRPTSQVEPTILSFDKIREILCGKVNSTGSLKKEQEDNKNPNQ